MKRCFSHWFLQDPQNSSHSWWFCRPLLDHRFTFNKHGEAAVITIVQNFFWTREVIIFFLRGNRLTFRIVFWYHNSITFAVHFHQKWGKWWVVCHWFVYLWSCLNHVCRLLYVNRCQIHRELESPNLHRWRIILPQRRHWMYFVNNGHLEWWWYQQRKRQIF